MGQARGWRTSNDSRNWFKPATKRLPRWGRDSSAWKEAPCEQFEDDSSDPVIAGLEGAASVGDEIGFLTNLQTIELDRCSPSQFLQIIKLAFRAGAFIAARDIATEGFRHHPEDPELNRYVQILTSTRRVGTQQMALIGSRSNMEWLNEHAGEYSGQWLALRDGQLLGSSKSLEELVREVSSRYSVTFPSKEVMLTTGY